ncbi:MAG: 2-keto-3-deoxy-galactonokinase [Marinosulfonomonas sp.]|nr:MAG: 2-keto-3-deoxy-galactonokinase [Marinosulfonomonas sp.]
MTLPDWIAVDWGTSNLRAWAIAQDGSVLDHRRSDTGMSKLEKAEYEPALLALIDDWLQGTSAPVICCGMVGSQQGWVEAPYRTAPCPPFGSEAVPADTKDPRLSVYVVPGIKQTEPADVMRGEETQIAGVLAQKPDFDRVICLPGTHSKWVRISAGEIVSFVTFLTGEMFALLSEVSVLRHCVATSGWDDDSFQMALNDAMTSPKMFAARLFNLRAETLVADLSPESARARLSGLLIGLELAAARPYWLGQDVVIVGTGHLSETYEQALTYLGAGPKKLDATKVTIAGLSLAHITLGKCGANT